MTLQLKVDAGPQFQSGNCPAFLTYTEAGTARWGRLSPAGSPLAPSQAAAVTFLETTATAAQQLSPALFNNAEYDQRNSYKHKEDQS